MPKEPGLEANVTHGGGKPPAAPSAGDAAAPGRRQFVKGHARRHFERWAIGYDRSKLNELVFFPSIRACQEEIIRWQRARVPKPYRLLDVGCGTGTPLSVFAGDPLAERVVGLDYSPNMVQRAAQKISAHPAGKRMHAVCGDAERLPFADASFDVVTCCNSFHHYPHQAEAIAGFRRVLRPGGLLVLIDGFRDNVIGWVLFDVFVERIEKHVHHASWSELRRWILDAGFRSLHQRKMNVLAPLIVNTAQR